MYNSTEIANNIKQIAKDKGIVLKTMFHEIGIGENTMANFKKSMPKVDTLGKIADYLNVSMDYLTGRTKEPVQIMNNNSTINGGIQTQNYNNSAELNGLQKEMIEAMEQLPKTKQLEALQEVYKMIEKENKQICLD